MTRLDEALAGTSRLAIDTGPVIYLIEVNPRYDALVTEVFKRIASGQLSAVTSVITLAEVLVQPLLRGDLALQKRYRDLLTTSAGFRTLPIDAVTAERAAGLRAAYRLRMPDALQLALALEAGCEAFLTNDSQLKRVSELRVLVLDELSLT